MKAAIPQLRITDTAAERVIHVRKRVARSGPEARLIRAALKSWPPWNGARGGKNVGLLNQGPHLKNVGQEKCRAGAECGNRNADPTVSLQVCESRMERPIELVKNGQEPVGGKKLEQPLIVWRSERLWRFERWLEEI